MFIFLLFIFFSPSAQTQDSIPIYPHGEKAPKFGQTCSDVQPFLLFFPSNTNSEKAIVLFPGGGYSHLAFEKEGVEIARWLSSIGWNAFVLRYRHGGDGCKHPIPLNDAAAALRTLKEKHVNFGIDTGKLGVMGFSAGGHLAASLSTLYAHKVVAKSGKPDEPIARPAFTVLIYPVVSMVEDYHHAGSRRQLLGEEPSVKDLELLSAERQVNASTAPAFLLHSSDDKKVPPEHSIQYYAALKKHGVKASLHIFQQGGHGFGMRKKEGSLSQWPLMLQAWLEDLGF